MLGDMNVTDFLDEWNRTHTSSPSYQDVLDWAEKEHSIEMQEQNKEWKISFALQEQSVMNKICKWLNANLPNYITDDNFVRMNKADFIEELRNAMAAEKEDETFK